MANRWIRSASLPDVAGALDTLEATRAETESALDRRLELTRTLQGLLHTGCGLGLAVVRAVAESHGGTVVLEHPASGRGARFVVSIPAKAQPLAVRDSDDAGSAL